MKLPTPPSGPIGAQSFGSAQEIFGVLQDFAFTFKCGYPTVNVCAEVQEYKSVAR
jgi:hypothetical protein